MTRRKEKTRVGYVLRKFPVLSETFVLNEILGLENQGVPVEIFSLSPPRDPRFHDGIVKLRGSIRYVPGLSDLKTLFKYNARAAKRFRGSYYRALLYVLARPNLLWKFLQSGYIAELTAQFKLSHLHAHFATRATIVASLVSRISAVSYSFTAHAFDIYKSNVKPSFLERHIDRSRFVVTISETNLEYLTRFANGSPQKIVLVRNGIDLSSFTPTETEHEPPFTILTVARLVEKKGVPILVEACRLLRDRGIEFRCRIVGRGQLRRQLQSMINDWGLRREVQFVGGLKQSDVRKEYQKADVFALPSIVDSNGNREGLPVSIVEALASGLPVVSTANGGIPEILTHGENGLLVPERDPVALADALESLITDPQLYEHLRANCRRSVDPTYDLKATSGHLRDLFVEARP